MRVVMRVVMMRSGDDWVKHPKVAQKSREHYISSRKKN